MRVETWLRRLKSGEVPFSTPEALLHRAVALDQKPVVHISKMRSYVHARYRMYSLVDQQWTATLAAMIGRLRVLEVMAGSGLLARALSDHGVNIIATELEPPRRTFCRVHKMDAVSAVLHHRDCDTLLMSWPPYEDPVSEAVARAWGPDRPIIYVGEHGGCTGSHAFNRGILVHHSLEIPSWPDIHDRVMVCSWRGDHHG